MIIIQSSYFLELVPDVVVEDLLAQRTQGGDRGEDARVELAVRADLLYHVHEVAVPLLHRTVEPVYAALRLVFAKACDLEV